jgi:uncharacterized protein YlzI (FlbEa/FlbD family)
MLLVIDEKLQKIETSRIESILFLPNQRWIITLFSGQKIIVSKKTKDFIDYNL